ncbi:MAG: alanine:cation symporter family protein, partial [Prevotellaceae bacterium]|jgi:AGCS family alanine or glycine:cation symporter|nr:alanine:cation symporter family protein [Prevotellaceae bacterium]
MINILRISVLVVTYFTGVNAMTLAWNMADIGVGFMAWLNLVALILLQKTALKTFFDFEKQLKMGIDNPVFNPKNLGIKNTEEWQ